MKSKLLLKEKIISLNKSNNKKKLKTNPTGKYFRLFLDKLFNFDSNIIIERDVGMLPCLKA